ncbi:MAG: serine hydrolase [Xanthomonadaceae bacterium]|nr:serine hydrolase [Xanthomonadaceae bacterium]
MSRLFAIAIAALFAGPSLGAQEIPVPGTDTAPVVAETDPELTAFVDGLARALVRDKDLPGLTVGIVSPDAAPLVKGYGLADVEAGTPVDGSQTLFRIGSVSKTFTWTAVMMLIERGLLDPDADINTYLKQVRVDDAFDAPVTMHHLMSHRAGFEDTFAVFTVSDDDPRSRSELLALHQPRRVFPPGARTSYSNWGAALAAQVVEDVAGVPYDTFLYQEILAPLGMDSTNIEAPSRMAAPLKARLAKGYEFAQGGHVEGEPMQIGAYAPAGAMASTAADMTRWMRFHLNGGQLDGVRLLGAKSHALMRTRVFDDRPEAADVAHGFQSRTHRGVSTLGHGGATALYRAQMVLAPDLGLGIFVAQNSNRGGYAALSTLTDLVVERFAPSPADMAGAATSEPAPAASAADYVGRYRNNRRSFSTFTAAFSTDESLVVVGGEDGALIVTANDQPRRYLPVPGTADLFEADTGARLMFQRDDAGQVTTANDSSGVHSYERSGALNAGPTLVLSLVAATLLALTTLLGTAWRWGRPAVRTAPGLLASRVAVFSALSVLLFLTIAVATVAVMSGLGASDLLRYPPTVMHLARAAGWLLAVMAAIMLLALRPAWAGSNWGLWRRLHFTAFALALAFLVFQLWQWRVIGAPLI